MAQKRLAVTGARVLVLGMAFKENCPDLRNTRVVDVVEMLESYSILVDVYDPWVESKEAFDKYGVKLIGAPEMGVYDGILLAVAHSQFVSMGASRIREFGKSDSLFFDLKSVFPAVESDIRL